MNTVMRILTCAVIGGVVGTIHFGMLLFTVRRITRTGRPGAALAVSALVRFAVILAGFVSAALIGGFKGLMAALAALLIVRTLIVRRVRKQGARETAGSTECGSR
mgnify:CR=1 FL=1